MKCFADIYSVFLHILLVGRCCAYLHRKDRSLNLGEHDIDEGDLLLALMDRRRRRRLEQGETGDIEVRRESGQTVDAGVDHDDHERHTEEDLIDMDVEERQLIPNEFILIIQ